MESGWVEGVERLIRIKEDQRKRLAEKKKEKGEKQQGWEETTGP